MKLNELLAGVGTEPPAGAKHKADITGLCNDSRQVKAGDLFIAVPGAKTDGSVYAAEAVGKGAIAVVSEKDVPEVKVPVFKVTSARKAMALIAANFYKKPADELAILAVTGTNGKTTVSWLLESICAAGGAQTGVLGTIENRFAGIKVVPKHTTPDPLELHQTFRAMVDAGVDTVVMEVSSHALDQDRVHGLVFKQAAFTNLTRDHLDYHKDQETYFQAKRKLFTENLSPGGVAVVNGDDTYGVRIYSEMRGLKRMAWKFSRTGAGEISAAAIELTNNGIKATLKTPAGDIAIKSSLIGAHNLENILCAAGVALAAGYSRRDVQDGIERVTRVPGRMERVTGKLPGVVALVDYAHTDDALKKSLESARSVTRGRLIVVFGCGGDRDEGKRPLMGEAAAELSDLAIVTSDNPRSEDPDDIIGEITPGIEKHGIRRMGANKAKSGEQGYLVEADRAAAIALAVSLAKDGDTILIAGKGHETYQEQNGVKKPFDDIEEVRKALGA